MSFSQELHELPPSSLRETNGRNGLDQIDALAVKIDERQEPEESCTCLLQEETIKEMTIDLPTSLLNSSSNKNPLRQQAASLLISCFGELFGTWLLTLIICSVVTAAIITEAQKGLWQVALPCGLGVAISIFISAHFSDAHLNPAVSIAFAVVRFRQFHCSRLGPYVLSQFLGSLIAGLIVFIFYHGAIHSFEEAHNITRGEPGSELSGMVFGEYFPNPALYNHNEFSSVTSVFEAFLIEAWGTFIFVFVIFSLTHPSNNTISNTKVVIPIIIGLTVSVIISIYGPLTQAGINPARDFGPRVIAALAGWGTIAIPGPRYGFWLYIIGPIIGGVLGGGASDLTLYCFRRFKK